MLIRDGVPVDREETAFGIRKLQWDAIHGLRINGKVVKLRGGCVHHDNGVLGAAAFGRAEERRVQLLKAAGYNAIRSAHNPISTAMLDACDRLGMLVMDEAFDAWTSSKSDFDYSLDLPTWWRDDLAAMVVRDRNHPSVIMYSIGNEIPEIGSPWGAQLGREMVEAVKELDSSRPVTNGINPFFAFMADVRAMRNAPEGTTPDIGINTLMTQLADAGANAIAAEGVTQRIDESMSLLDVGGYNYAEGRYELDLERHPQRLIVGTESHTATIERVWELVQQHPRVLGDFAWTAWDYLGEAGIGRTAADADDTSFLGGYPWRTAWAGDLDITGTRRPVSYYRETVWGLRDEPFLAVHRPGTDGAGSTPWAWSNAESSWSWPGHEGTPVRVDVYADADEIELTCNGRVIGRATVGRQRQFMTTFETTYQPGELAAAALRSGTVISRTSLTSAGDEVVLHAVADRSLIHDSDHDLAFIQIELTDDKGVLHTILDRAVQVTIDGPAVLQGLGSADPCALDDYTSNVTRTFAGRALAAVRPTAVGALTVKVEAEGCTPVSVAITCSARP